MGASPGRWRWQGSAGSNSTCPDGRATPDSMPALKRAIAEDRENGLEPFLLIGTAGTVDVGAIDDLAALAGLG